ncbi:MAG TPA: heme exporter protein CcmB [Bacteroidia bacterium]|nr:heme exporter protein CcmB [Bacteroidia bacterium]MBX3106937.1 heme exporter protein CcmB [Bacteroidota bacterium]MCE7954270.1 ABC transporter permease [Bacteroidetes bacterium CHB6]MCB0850224.1 heme exporter protein CcmB [Bacteroidota bacterium]MCB8930163.1 heme exporter protein CcmB [Bacteroidia bacterium]
MLSQIGLIIAKEWKLEWRNRSAIAGLSVYILSGLYISYLSFKKIADPATWNALFWILILFMAVNALAKSFMTESRGLQLFYYTFLNPQVVIIGKIIYNGVLLFVLGLLTLLFYTILLGNPVQDSFMFLITLLAGCFGISSVLTMISAIASRAGHQSSMMAILGFPVLLPLLIILIHLSKNAIDGIEFSVNVKYLTLILSLNLIVPALAFILFPYLWRE